MKYITILALTLISLTAFGQAEIELRTDGIVVPRLNSGDVPAPITGQVIYDTVMDQLMYYDGSNWKVLSGAFERKPLMLDL